jgi:hypothetical protein
LTNLAKRFGYASFFFEFLDFWVVGGLGSGWAKLNVLF